MPSNDPTYTFPNTSATGAYPHAPSLTDYRFNASNTDRVAMVWYNDAGTWSSEYKVTDGGYWTSAQLFQEYGEIGEPGVVDETQQASLMATTNANELSRTVVRLSTAGPPYSLSSRNLPTPLQAPGPVLTFLSPVNNSPRLSWTVPQGTMQNYKIYRYLCDNPGPDCFEGFAPLLATVTGTGTTYTDYGVIIGNKNSNTQVYYYVVATYPSGASTMPSNKGMVYQNIIYQSEHKEITEKSIPTETKLAANYTNPFNPTTRFDYQLAQEGHVTLIVYNLLGQEVVRLIDEYREAGYFNITWDASAQSSSLYYARMIVTDASGKQQYLETRQLLLLK